jgi:hypothetical protein
MRPGNVADLSSPFSPGLNIHGATPPAQYIVTWMAKALLGNDSMNTLKRTQQYKYECLLLVAGQQAAHQ